MSVNEIQAINRADSFHPCDHFINDMEKKFKNINNTSIERNKYKYRCTSYNAVVTFQENAALYESRYFIL